MEFLQTFLSCHFVRKPVVVSQNVGCFLMIRLHNYKHEIIIMINIKYSYIVRNKIHFIIVTDKKSWLENRWVKLILSAMKLFPQTRIKFITSFYCLCKNLTSFHWCLQFVQKTDNNYNPLDKPDVLYNGLLTQILMINRIMFISY